MPTTTILLIIAAFAGVAVIAYFVLRGSRGAVGVAASQDGGYTPPPAEGEAVIFGDVIVVGEPPRANAGSRSLPLSSSKGQTDNVEEPRQAEPQTLRQSEPQTLRQSELVEDCATQVDIRWPKRFESAGAPFDAETRLNLLRDLGIVRAPWGVPLLAQAYEEEPAVEHRRAALRALAAYRHPDAQATFELVLHDDEDEESRAIAANALTALQIRAALPS